MNKIIPDDLSSFTRLGQSEIELYTSPPVSVTMLTKTFIHDSLYNPNYGYFSKQVYDPTIHQF